MSEKLAELKKSSGGNNSNFNYAIGTATLSSSLKTKITLGFKPRIIVVKGNNNSEIFFYNADFNPSYQFRNNGGAGGGYSVPETTNAYNTIATIDDDGFTMNRANWTTVSYYAYGYEPQS